MPAMMRRRRQRSSAVVAVTSVVVAAAGTSAALSGLSVSCAQGVALPVLGRDGGGGLDAGVVHVGSGDGGGGGGVSGGVGGAEQWSIPPPVSPVAALWANPVSVRRSTAAVPQPRLALVTVGRAAGGPSDGLLSHSSRALRNWALAGTYRYTGMDRYTASGAYQVCPATLTVRAYDPESLPRDEHGSLWLPPSTVVWNGTDACVDGGAAAAAATAKAGGGMSQPAGRWWLALLPRRVVS